jgi:hypothetical protein
MDGLIGTPLDHAMILFMSMVNVSEFKSGITYLGGYLEGKLFSWGGASWANIWHGTSEESGRST